ncbi:MAG: DUF4397 domain-containing protein [Terracidiphilus sp.]
MKTTWKDLWKNKAGRLTPSRLAVIATVLLGLSLALSACQNVAGFTQPSLVRVIDASYIAPAINVFITSQGSNVELAGNIGQGTITDYGTVPASAAALVKITEVTSSKTIVSSNVTILGGHQHSIFLTDNGAAPNSYEVTVLEDQQVAAAGGHSAFRFLNQAPKTGAIDVYMVPSGTTLANTIPIVTGLPVGGTAGYILFTSQSVTMVITPTGTTTPKYTSTALGLTGGEVRTVLIYDSQLTSNPPVFVTMANDVN